jgi:hypothetical protein
VQGAEIEDPFGQVRHAPLPCRAASPLTPWAQDANDLPLDDMMATLAGEAHECQHTDLELRGLPRDHYKDAHARLFHASTPESDSPGSSLLEVRV